MPPILVPSSAKLIATKMLVIEELNDIIRPSKKLPAQSKLLKHKDRV